MTKQIIRMKYEILEDGEVIAEAWDKDGAESIVDALDGFYTYGETTFTYKLKDGEE